MKIKSLLLLLVLILSLGLVLCLASCEEEAPSPEDPGNTEQPGDNTPGDEEPDDENEPHVHAFGNWTVIKEATCGSAGQSLRLCGCGEREYQTVFATEDHLYGAENKCIVCKDTWEYYATLDYALNADGLSYTVVSYSGNIEEELTLPCFYNGLPVTAIGENAFRAIETLSTVHLTDYITTIGAGAFEGCASLTQILFEKNSHLISIGERAFAKTAITAFEIFADVVMIGDGAFAECSALAKLTVAEGNSRYAATKGGCLVDIASGTLLRMGDTGEFPSDMTVTAIAPYAFAGCGADEITIPASVTAIAANAFADCNSTKVSFQSLTGWYVTETKGEASGTAVTVTDSATNLQALTGDYQGYYWYWVDPDAA